MVGQKILSVSQAMMDLRSKIYSLSLNESDHLYNRHRRQYPYHLYRVQLLIEPPWF